MLRRDLEAAGIAYAVQASDGPRYADFHSLRHSYLTLLGRSGVDLRNAQILTGHSKPELTARYSHRNLVDLVLAVGKLPVMVPNGSSSVVGTEHPELQQVAQICTSGTVERSSADVTQILEM